MVSGRERPVRRDWQYEKVRQKVFDAYTGGSVEGLRRFIAAGSGEPEKLE